MKSKYFTLTSAKVPGSCFKFTHVMYITDSTSLKTRLSFLVIFISSMKPSTSVLLSSVLLAKFMRKKNFTVSITIINLGRYPIYCNDCLTKHIELSWSRRATSEHFIAKCDNSKLKNLLKNKIKKMQKCKK